MADRAGGDLQQELAGLGSGGGELRGLEGLARPLEEGDPSATRTTLTTAPLAHKASDRAALNVASPHGVGGYVLRTPTLDAREKRCGPIG